MNDLAEMIIRISCKKLKVTNIDGNEFLNKYGYRCPVGVNGRNSDNNLYRKRIGWEVSQPLEDGIRKLYEWIEQQVKNMPKHL